ncbi:MAG: PAS domain-containing protein [Candidatus Rokubacteria bacterium]|nr:PAS domain-containing protein [Candidatus Rokubacteria bacterium]
MSGLAAGGILAVLLLAALIASWRRSRALAAATHALRDSHARALLAQARSAFLADVSRLLADGHDAQLELDAVARRAVPFLADACVIDVVDDEGTNVRASVSEPGVASTPPALSLPLTARGRTLGQLALYVRAGRQLGAEDHALAEDLARRVALAVDNARLFREADDARQRLHELVAGLGAVVWEADAVRRHHTFVNGRPDALFGFGAARWLDQPDFWLAIQHPDDRERSAAAGRAARGRGADHDLEYRVQTSDGRTVWILDLVRPVRHPDGTVRSLRGVMIDVSESKRAQAALQQAASLASVAALANAAAHEINNPLAIIIGNLEMFARRPETTPVAAVRMEAMLAAARRIAGIINSMQRITHLENATTNPELPVMLDLHRSSAGDGPRVA